MNSGVCPSHDEEPISTDIPQSSVKAVTEACSVSSSTTDSLVGTTDPRGTLTTTATPVSPATSAGWNKRKKGTFH